jgi:hypothetical protein
VVKVAAVVPPEVRGEERGLEDRAAVAVDLTAAPENTAAAVVGVPTVLDLRMAAVVGGPRPLNMAESIWLLREVVAAPVRPILQLPEPAAAVAL